MKAKKDTIKEYLLEIYAVLESVDEFLTILWPA